MPWWTPSGTNSEIVLAAQRQMVRSNQIDLVRMIEGAIAEQARSAEDMVQVIGETFAIMQGQKRQLFKDAHRDVGQAALRSLQQGYRSRRFRRPAGRYRAGEDRLSGTLSKALGSESHIRVSEHTLEFLDTTLLDREAAHWRRLNFGAGGGGEEGIIAPQQFPITWGGLMVGVLGLESQPSAPFRIPRGFWIGQEGRVPADKSRVGRDQFFLVGQIGGRGIRGRPSAGVMTAGIASRNFVDASVRRIANELPPTYANIYERLYETSRSELERIAARTGTRVVRPSSQTFGYNWRRSNRGTSLG